MRQRTHLVVHAAEVSGNGIRGRSSGRVVEVSFDDVVAKLAQQQARLRDGVALRETPEYAALFSRVWHSLGEEFSKARGA